MSKKLIFSLLFTAVVSLVCLVGMRDMNSSTAATVTINLPYGWMLLSPKDEVESMASSIAVVRSTAGNCNFLFDCDGKQIEIQHRLKPGMQTWTPTESD